MYKYKILRLLFNIKQSKAKKNSADVLCRALHHIMLHELHRITNVKLIMKIVTYSNMVWWIWKQALLPYSSNFWRVSHSVTHKHELWIWFTLSYAMMKALLRLSAVRDTKQAVELRGDTVHFIASSSALVSMTQNGNIYRPLTQTATCLLRLYSSKHIAERS